MGHRAAYQRPGDPFPQRFARQGKLTTNKIVEFIIANCRGLVVQRRQPQLGGADLLFFTQQYRVMQSVLQLANIARPGVLHQPCQRLRGQTANRTTQTAGVEREKMVRQHRNILATLAQRRQRHDGDIQPVVEVFAETTLADGLHQIHVGGGDYPHIDLNGLA